MPTAVERTTITPVLSSAHGYIDDVRDQVASVVRFIILNPGWTSSIWEDKLVSFRKIAARYEKSRSDMTAQLSEAIHNVLSRMFDQYTFNCDFTTDDYQEGINDGRYSVKFTILVNTIGDETDLTQSALISGTILVNKDTNEITLKYDLNSDTASLRTRT